LHPNAQILRNRVRCALLQDTLGDDFRTVRNLIFPGDTRKLLDMRRTSAVEALAGEVDTGALSAKMANTISDSKALRTYLPVDKAAVSLVDEARRLGRRRILENRSGRKVETLRPGELKPKAEGDRK
jgi:hypothetical protein